MTSPEQEAKNKADVDEGLYRAAIARVKAGPEAAAAEARIHANLPDIIRRWYVGPGNAKGRQQSWFAPPDHLSPAQFHEPGVDAKGRKDGKW